MVKTKKIEGKIWKSEKSFKTKAKVQAYIKKVKKETKAAKFGISYRFRTVKTSKGYDLYYRSVR